MTKKEKKNNFEYILMRIKKLVQAQVCNTILKKIIICGVNLYQLFN